MWYLHCRSVFSRCEVMILFPAITGLPLNITDEEFTDMMSKYGIIMQDPDASKSYLIIVCDHGLFEDHCA